MDRLFTIALPGIFLLYKSALLPLPYGDLHVARHGCRPQIALFCWSWINSSLPEKELAAYFFQVNRNNSNPALPLPQQQTSVWGGLLCDWPISGHPQVAYSLPGITTGLQNIKTTLRRERSFFSFLFLFFEFLNFILLIFYMAGSY